MVGTMPTKVAEVKPSNAALQAVLPKQGKIALLWQPSKERHIAGTVGNSPAVRMYTFPVLDQYYRQIDGREIPKWDMLELRLLGRNWVDNSLWQKAKEQSRAMPGDPIGMRLKLQAIVELVPIVEVLTGTLADYDYDSATAIVDGIWDADVLRAEQKSARDSDLVSYIVNRITRMERGELTY
jgi:hypothetical protein